MFPSSSITGKAPSHSSNNLADKSNESPGDLAKQETVKSATSSLPSQKQIVDQILAMESQIRAQTDYMKKQNDLIQKLQNQINTSEMIISKKSETKESNLKPPKEKLPMLEKFKGNRAMWDEWHLTATHKLKKDGPAIGNTFDQFMYIYARLDGEAAKMVSTTAKMLSESETGHGHNFLQYLNSVFGDPNKKARAQQQLYNLRQKEKEPFSSFLPRFETILATAGWSHYDDEQKISLLKNALSKEIRTALIGRMMPVTWAECISFILTISSEIAALNQQFRQLTPHPTQSNQSTQPTTTYPSSMDWEPVRATVAATQDMSTGKRATWVKKETLAFRKKKGLCMRCGNRGHIAPKCPLLPPIRPSFSVKKIQLTAEEEDELERLAEPDVLDEEEKEELP